VLALGAREASSDYVKTGRCRRTSNTVSTQWCHSTVRLKVSFTRQTCVRVRYSKNPPLSRTRR